MRDSLPAGGETVRIAFPVEVVIDGKQVSPGPRLSGSMFSDKEATSFQWGSAGVENLYRLDSVEKKESVPGVVPSLVMRGRKPGHVVH